MEKIKIVPAAEEYIDAACDIAIKAWSPIREVFRGDLGDERYEVYFSGWQQAKRNATARRMRVGRGYIALAGDKVVGFIAYIVDEETKTGEVCGSAVDPECRGMRIGPQMYDFVLNKTKEEGMEYATVFTVLDGGHAPARRACEKAGFQKNLPSIRYCKKL